MGNVALVPERDVFQRGHGVAADHAGEAAEFFAGDGVALVRHGGAAFLSGGKILLHLEHLGALEVAKLRGPAVDGRRDEREHGLELRVAVALDDLRGKRRCCEAQLFTHPLFDPRIEVRVRADGPAQFAHADARLHFLEARQGATEFVIHERQLEPECHRLCVDAVTAADHRRRLEFPRPPGDDRAQFPQVREQQVGGFGHLHGQRGIEHVARSHALVHPPAGRPDVARHIFQKRDHVVIGAFFDLHDLREVEFPLRADFLGIALRHHADLGLRLAGQGLDFEPDFVFALIRPDGGHFGSCVTFDHPADATGGGGFWEAASCSGPPESEKNLPRRGFETTGGA